MNGKRNTRQTAFTIGLLILLAVLSVAGALQENDPDFSIPLDSTSTAPNGAAALARWMKELGYPVSTEIGTEFAVPSEAQLAFVLEPFDIADRDLALIERWVEAGGTLIFAGERLASNPLLARFDVARRAGAAPEMGLAPGLPLLTSPRVETPVLLDASSYLDPDFADFAPLFAGPGGPVVLAFERGAGRVILSSEPFPFTNMGLKSPGSPEFVLNLVGTVPRGAQIWFDEWHHGQRPVEPGPAGPGAWLRETPAGRSILFSAAVLFAWLALSGRAFGPPVQPAGQSQRRSPLEFVTAIAGLNQRAGNHVHLLENYHRQLKRELGRRYHLDPRLPDGAFVEELRSHAPGVNADDLARLLGRLNSRRGEARELVELAADAARLLERLQRSEREVNL